MPLLSPLSRSSCIALSALMLCFLARLMLMFIFFLLHGLLVSIHLLRLNFLCSTQYPRVLIIYDQLNSTIDIRTRNYRSSRPIFSSFHTSTLPERVHSKFVNINDRIQMVNLYLFRLHNVISSTTESNGLTMKHRKKM